MLTFAQQTISKLTARFGQQKLVRNIGWLTSAELISRVGRIVAAIILARQLDAVAFGIAAIALTIFEITRVFTENGIGAAVVRASADQFERVSNTAYRLMWIVCIGLAGVQISAGLIVEMVLPGRDAGLMVARASYIGGFLGTSNVQAGKLYGLPIYGTMAHSYVESFDREIDSFRAFAKSFPDNTVLLIDTYDTLAGARKAVTVAQVYPGAKLLRHG